MERAIEKAGGVTRKPADLESILGPAPAQPSMSAFSFPMAPGSGPTPAIPVNVPPPPVIPAAGVPAVPAPAPRPVPASISKETPPVVVPMVPPNAGRAPPPPARPHQPPPVAGRPAPVPAAAHAPPPKAAPAPAAALSDDDDGDEDQTMVGAVPAELLAQATGENRAADEAAEWLTVYEDFVRTKKQCGEPTDGLSFDKFSQTLKKNRDALVQRHACKRVKFSVYVKEGRASLKATPVRE
jgi:hypothetical protein